MSPEECNDRVVLYRNNVGDYLSPSQRATFLVRLSLLRSQNDFPLWHKYIVYLTKKERSAAELERLFTSKEELRLGLRDLQRKWKQGPSIEQVHIMRMGHEPRRKSHTFAKGGTMEIKMKNETWDTFECLAEEVLFDNGK